MAGSTADAALAQRLLEKRSDYAYAPWLDRRPSREILESHGLPGRRAEAWRHTNVGRWYETALADAEAAISGNGAGVRIHAPDGVEVVDFANARAAELAAGVLGQAFELAAQPLAAVNALLLGAGVVIRAPRGLQAKTPVRIQRLGAAYQQVLIVVEPQAALTVVEEPATCSHRIVEGAVGAGATLTHLRRQGAAASRECSLVAVRVAAGGRYALAQTSLGAELRRNDIIATLAGVGAEASISSAWQLDARQHLDNQIAVRHVAGGGLSRQTYRGVVAGRARAVLNGKIHIAPGAQATDAALTCKNLLASTTAEVYAKPELTIHADDVKCSHGATVGALDEEAVFFLRARGIAEDAARALLTRGFLREAIADEAGARQLGLIP